MLPAGEIGVDARLENCSLISSMTSCSVSPSNEAYSPSQYAYFINRTVSVDGPSPTM